MSSAELSEWMAYQGLEPFGAPASHWQFAVLCALIANINRNPKQKPSPYTPEEFFNPGCFGLPPDWKRPVQKQSVEEMKRLLMGIHQAQNQRSGNKQADRRKRK